jgi:hypothetical protein
MLELDSIFVCCSISHSYLRARSILSTAWNASARDTDACKLSSVAAVLRLLSRLMSAEGHDRCF